MTQTPIAELVTCRECGLEYRPQESLKQLCPGCLYRGLAGEILPGAADSQVAEAADKHRFRPPTIDELRPHFERLEILELLGYGGMSAVYKARQTSVDRVVALKILPQEVADIGGGAERFARETKTLARMSHPNVVALYDAGQAGPWCYCVMEFVSGPNLRHVIGDSRLTPADVVRLVPDICDGLQYAHDQGVVHRDIKPENILVDEHGRAKIADFGLAKVLHPADGHSFASGTQHVVGTPRYIAPEQMERPADVDHRADLYSLGVMLYEMLTGEIPAGNFDPPSGKGDSDARLDDVVLRALASEPDRRYQSARDLRTDILSLPARTEAAARVERRGPTDHKWGRPAELLLSLLSLALVPMAVTGIVESSKGLMSAHTDKQLGGAILAMAPCLFLAIGTLLARVNVSSVNSWRGLTIAQALSAPVLLAGHLIGALMTLLFPGALIVGLGAIPLVADVERWQMFGELFGDTARSQALSNYWLTVIGAALLVSAAWSILLSAAVWRWPVIRTLFHPTTEAASRPFSIGLLVLAVVVFLPSGAGLLYTAGFVD